VSRETVHACPLLTIRHVSGDRVVAYLEILSPVNKSSRAALDRSLDKAVAVLNHGCHLLLGAVLPDMPLFLQDDWYVNVPLEATYQEAYATVPGRWREVIEGPGDARSE
jgi:hypothetical protein